MWTVEDVREVEEAVRTQVERRSGSEARPRPLRGKGARHRAKFDEFIPGDVSPKSSPEPREEGHNHSGGGSGHHKHH